MLLSPLLHKTESGNSRSRSDERPSKREKDERAKLKARRDKLRSQGKSTEVARWSANKSAAGPGVFFGEVGRTKGYWQRPSARGGKLGKPLTRFADDATYKPTFPWDETNAKFIKGVNLSKYAFEIERAISKIK